MLSEEYPNRLVFHQLVWTLAHFVEVGSRHRHLLVLVEEVSRFLIIYLNNLVHQFGILLPRSTGLVIDDALVILRTEYIRLAISSVFEGLAYLLYVVKFAVTHAISCHCGVAIFAFLSFLDLSKVIDAFLPIYLCPCFEIIGAILAYFDVVTSCYGFTAAATVFALVFG